MPRKIPTHRSGPSKQAVRKAYEKFPGRIDDRKFYNSAAWRALRAVHLAEHPMCSEPDCNRPATHVHHRVDRKADPSRALDPANLESQCQPCHNRQRGTQ